MSSSGACRAPVPSAWSPAGTEHWEDSPGQAPAGSTFPGGQSWLPLQGASACSVGAPSSSLGASCPGREQATSGYCRCHRWTEAPTGTRKQGSLKPHSQPHKQGRHPAHSIPAQREFAAPPESRRLLQVGPLLRPCTVAKATTVSSFWNLWA